MSLLRRYGARPARRPHCCIAIGRDVAVASIGRVLPLGGGSVVPPAGWLWRLRRGAGEMAKSTPVLVAKGPIGLVSPVLSGGTTLQNECGSAKPARPVVATPMPFSPQMSAQPSVLRHKMSDLRSPLKSPVPSIVQSGPLHRATTVHSSSGDGCQHKVAARIARGAASAAGMLRIFVSAFHN